MLWIPHKNPLDFYENEFNSKKDVIASYQQAIVDTLIEKVRRAIKKTNVDTIVIAGGVAANQCLRKKIKIELKNAKIIFPDLKFCTDNAAMISFLGELKLNSSCNYSLKFSALPNMKLQ